MGSDEPELALTSALVVRLGELAWVSGQDHSQVRSGAPDEHGGGLEVIERIEERRLGYGRSTMSPDRADHGGAGACLRCLNISP